jgi:hypothetical protein
MLVSNDSSRDLVTSEATNGTASSAKDLTSKLLELAGYPTISATANVAMTQITNYKLDVKDPDITERKIYIPTYLNGFRLVGCLDSGSDLTILHFSVYSKIFRNKPLQKGQVPAITTFSDTVIPVCGTFKCPVQLRRNTRGVNVEICVIKDIPNQSAWLIGNDFLRAGLGSISFEDKGTGTYPVVTFKRPEFHNCNIYYTPPKELNICYAEVDLRPF